MSKALLFLPDISGFTEFVQTTEAQHSQHVIAELLEVMIDANNIDLELAEVEGDALFFFREQLPSSDQLFSQIENMFTAFYSHLKLLEKNRVCPCNACSSAPNLQLKIIAHAGDVEFITVQGKRKPFGTVGIEAHRLMKNDVKSDNYVLISDVLANDLFLNSHEIQELYHFKNGVNSYDNKEISYIHSDIDKSKLKLKPFATAQKIHLQESPDIIQTVKFKCNAETGIEWVSNYANRYLWVDGVDKFIYNENEVTRLGTEHVCVINGKHLNFVTVTKDNVDFDAYFYGEMTDGPPFVDKIYQFYTFTPIDENNCLVKVEIHIETKSLFKKFLKAIFVKQIFKKNIQKSIRLLEIAIDKETKKNNL